MAKTIFSAREKGQSLTEFSLMFILIILLIAGLTGVAQIGYHWAVMQYAASEASRFGSLGQIDAGFATREASVRNRVTQIAHDMGVDDITIQFIDETGGSTAGQSSEYYTLRLSRPVDLHPVILMLFGLSPNATLASQYQLVVQTVIRNEPF